MSVPACSDTFWIRHDLRVYLLFDTLRSKNAEILEEAII
jgi:hypothetical protein